MGGRRHVSAGCLPISMTFDQTTVWVRAAHPQFAGAHFTYSPARRRTGVDDVIHRARVALSRQQESLNLMYSPHSGPLNTPRSHLLQIIKWIRLNAL